MLITATQLKKTNAAGIRHSDTDTFWNYYSPLLQAAYDLGKSGVSIADCDVVTGWRYGAVPEFGVSRNYQTDESEGGCSMAKIDGIESTWKSFLMTDRNRVTVKGILLPVTGSDDEQLVFPVDCIENMDE